MTNSRRKIEQTRQAMLDEFEADQQVLEHVGGSRAPPKERGEITQKRHRTALQRFIEQAEGLDIEQVLRIYTGKQLSEKYNLNHSTISQWKRRFGWQLPKAGSHLTEYNLKRKIRKEQNDKHVQT